MFAAYPYCEHKLLKTSLASGEILTQLGLRGGFENLPIRFPKGRPTSSRFGLGFGEIIGPARNVSRQSDLVIFTALNGLSLMLSASGSGVPIELYAARWSQNRNFKDELVIALENIKSVSNLPKRKRRPIEKYSSRLPMCAGPSYDFRVWTCR